MTNALQSIESWGRFPASNSRLLPIVWSSDALPKADGEKILARGLGRSYGDCGLNDGGVLMPTPAMNHLLAFDQQTGVLRCEAGVSLDAILQFAVPRGWFLTTTPGTKFVTVGGAIANDVHGKNHHRAGTFGRHVRGFELLRSDGSRNICSPAENFDLFAATIGGMGLTGLITWAEIALRKITSAYLASETIKFGNLEEFFEISAESDTDYEHTVAWVDCLASGKNLGRGLFMRGNHAVRGPLEPHQPPKLAVPFDFPSAALNPASVQAFNTLYYGKVLQRVTHSWPHYEPFFYPLDSIHHWNRIYGKRGFFQYQFVVPQTSDGAAIREIFERIARSGQGSFLAVLKMFGKLPSPGLMSFPFPGVTLALDFANQGEPTLELFRELDRVVLAADGRFYSAKDARMPADCFFKTYPNAEKFRTFIDPAFSSSFWRRVSNL